MSEMLDAEGVKVDNQSQLMLWQLRDREWERALTLRRAANLDENRQVFYRMEKYLIPAGFVEEQVRDDPGDMRRFRLTERGAEWVEDKGKKLRMPTTHEQIQNYALEGYEAGTDAKESVQNYRKKVHRLKRRVERAEDDIEEVEDDQRENDKDVEYLRERSQAIRMRSIQNNNRLDSVEEDVEERATIGRVDGVRDDVSGVERRLATVEDKQVGLAREQAEAARTRARLRRLAKPAGYVAAGSVVVYFVLLVVVYLSIPRLVGSAVIAGIVVALGIGVVGGTALYVRGLRFSSSNSL